MRSICVVGGGRWGENHIRTLAELGLLGGIVEPDAARRAVLSAAHPGAEVFTSLEDAVERPFDGFVIATPAHTHAALARFVIDHGRHVLVEKPLALVARDARELCAAAERAGVVLMVGHVLLFHPAIRRIGELIRSGKIGRLQYLYSNRLNLGTVRTEENILWSFAPHDISIFDHWIGSPPLEVESRGGVFLQPAIQDTTHTLLRNPDNVVGHVFLSWLHPYKEHRIVVIGSKGMLSFEDSSTEKHVLFYEKGIDWVQGEPVPRDGPTEVIPYERQEPLAAELTYFAEHLDGRPIEIASGRSGVQVLEVLERATASLLGGAANGAAPAQPRVQGTVGAGATVHESAYVDAGAEIGERTRVWHFAHVQSGARVGADCTIGQSVNVANDVVIGDHCKIQNNVSVYQGVTLEDHVFCGPAMTFTNVRHPRSKYPQRGAAHYQPTLVRSGASIGANATIVCGTTIGRHAFIAAGAVVTRDVPDHALVAGVPAEQIGWVCECGERLGDGARPICGSCKRAYRRAGDTMAAEE